MPDLELHPGLHVSLARTRFNETDVAKMIAAGELTSPQRFANSWYFDLRLTGTGGSYRQGLKELVWRDPSIYLNQAFLDRCNGLPVVVEHPEGQMLDTREYKKRNIGTVVLPYIKGDEVWGVARILDQPAGRYMAENQLSTSPAVVFSDPDNSNEMIRARDGKHLLIEGDPNLLDHVAICEEGVWDKGGSPTGVDSVHVQTKEEGHMAEETKEQMVEQEEKDRRDRRDARTRDDAHRDDESEEEEAKKKEEEARADAARRDEKLDKLLSGIKVLGDRMDSIEGRFKDDAHRDDKRDDASASEEAEHAEQAAKLAKEESEEAKEAARGDRARRDDSRKGRRFDARRDDDEEEEMPWEECDRKDGEDDEEFSGRMDKLAAKCDAPSYRRRDDESMAAHCDRVARGSRRDRARRADRARMDAVDKLMDGMASLSDRLERLSKVTADRAPEEEAVFADAQARADSVFGSHGESAPRPLQGQSLMGYRIMLLRKLQKHSDDWRETDVAAVARSDLPAFGKIEAAVYADAQKAALMPTAGAGEFRLRPIRRSLEGGHTETKFVGHPLSWMSTFMAPGRTTTRLRPPPTR